MKKTLLFIIVLIVLIQQKSLFSQDIDLFNKQLNDNFNMPEIDKDMNFDEFQLLSRNLRMKHMLYAMAVPGYVHFYTQDNKIGYGMLGSRLLGYGGIAYVLLNTDNELDLNKLFSLTFDRSIFPEEDRKKFSTITNTSLLLIFGSYLFDWIHGQYKLHKKQEQIRFKYSMKLQTNSFNTFGTQELNKQIIVPSAKFTIFF